MSRRARKPKPFAHGTRVPVERTKGEIERLLTAHGATQVVIGSDAQSGDGFVLFVIAGRHFRRELPPRVEASKRDPAQLQRERWRTLLLLVKAKLQLVGGGASTVEQEFLSDTLLPSGERLGEVLAPRIAEAYDTGVMPRLLLGGS